MSTIRINLLPHREQRRALQQKTLVALAAATAVVGLLVVAVGHVTIAGMKDNQVRRNDFLRSEITKLDEQIKEIAALKEQTNSLLARKRIVESLQVNRARVVHLFDDLARQLPDGMYLKSLKQTGDKLSLQGYAQSSARVSALMGNIGKSHWMAEPVLIEVKATAQNNVRVSEFNLGAKQVVPEDTGATAAAGPVGGADKP